VRLPRRGAALALSAGLVLTPTLAACGGDDEDPGIEREDGENGENGENQEDENEDDDG
jgi:hypothetical protein